MKYKPITFEELESLGFKPHHKGTIYIKDLCNLVLKDGYFDYGTHIQYVAEKYHIDKRTSLSAAINVELKDNIEFKGLKPAELVMRICIKLRHI